MLFFALDIYQLKSIMVDYTCQMITIAHGKVQQHLCYVSKMSINDSWFSSRECKACVMNKHRPPLRGARLDALPLRVAALRVLGISAAGVFCAATGIYSYGIRSVELPVVP